MNDLISREELIKEVCGKCDGACDCCCEENCIQCKRPNMRCDFRKDLDDAPTVDAVPVVRCKDCMRRGTTDCSMLEAFNSYPFHEPEDDAFCSNGERRTDGKD